MSEHITHVAIYEDTVRLVTLSERFNEAFRVAFNDEYDSGVISCGASGNHLYAVPLVEEVRAKWGMHKGNTELKQKLAGALGWMTHRAADRQTKPIGWRIDEENNPKFSGSECKLYQDAASYKEVYEGGTKDNLSPFERFSTALLEEKMHSEPAYDNVNVEATEPLLTYMWQTDFIKLHQFAHKPDFSDEWLKKLFDHVQNLQENWNLYIEAFQNPDPDKWREYITAPPDPENWDEYVTGPAFYDRNDPLIRLVRSMQTGQRDNSIDFKEAMEEASKGSHYARSLYKSYQFLLAANDYFENRISKSSLYDALHIVDKFRNHIDLTK
jgi:hypothetical protein